ncbi:MAG TPA: hypothetical protein V6D48_24830 [Oculatellaceae cyanobacterium]
MVAIVKRSPPYVPLTCLCLLTHLSIRSEDGLSTSWTQHILKAIAYSLPNAIAVK